MIRCRQNVRSEREVSVDAQTDAETETENCSRVAAAVATEQRVQRLWKEQGSRCSKADVISCRREKPSAALPLTCSHVDRERERENVCMCVLVYAITDQIEDWILNEVQQSSGSSSIRVQVSRQTRGLAQAGEHERRKFSREQFIAAGLVAA